MTCPIERKDCRDCPYMKEVWCDYPYKGAEVVVEIEGKVKRLVCSECGRVIKVLRLSE